MYVLIAAEVGAIEKRSEAERRDCNRVCGEQVHRIMGNNAARSRFTSGASPCVVIETRMQLNVFERLLKSMR